MNHVLAIVYDQNAGAALSIDGYGDARSQQMGMRVNLDIAIEYVHADAAHSCADTYAYFEA